MGYQKSYSWKQAKHTQNTTNRSEMTVEEVLELPILAIENRGITQRTATHFGVRTEVSDIDQKPIAHYFPYTDEGVIVGFKKRDLTRNKKDDFHFSVVGRVKADCDLFGRMSANKSGGKKVYITEGEYDALVTWQVLKDEGSVQYVGSNPCVLSIGLGTANAVKHIGSKDNTRYLKKYGEIILVFDNDTVTPQEKAQGIKRGKEAAADVYGLIPDIKIVSLDDGNDPCDELKQLGSNHFYWSLQKPKRYTPEGFVTFEDIREEAITPNEIGRGWPWPTVMRETFGRRDGEGYYFGSGVKMGKSTLLDKMVEYITTQETRIDSEGNSVRRKAALFKFEEKPAQTLKKVAGKIVKKDLSNPSKRVYLQPNGAELDIWGEPIPPELRHTYYTDNELVDAIDQVGDSLILYNNYGRCEWSELKGAIRHAVLVEHVKDIFIDPITRLTAGMSASDANTELEHFADEISKMAQDLGFTYYCFCHLKAPDYGPKHEVGGKINSAQFRGSRAMMQACYYTVGLEGNKDPDLCPRIRNTRYFIIMDDRANGNTCKIPLFYDEDTGDFVEPPQAFIEQESEEYDRNGNYQTVQTLAEWNQLYPLGYKEESY